MRRTFKTSLALLLLAMVAWPARGAELEVRRLAPRTYRLTLPEAMGASWREVVVGRLYVRVAGGAAVLDREPLPESRDLDFAVDAPGCALVQVDVGPAGLDETTDAWEGVNHCSKIVLCADTGDPAADRRERRAAGGLLTAKSGSRIEIRPLFNPATLVAGSAFPVRLYASGRAVAGAEVVARGPSGERAAAAADRHGIAVLALPVPGAWSLHFHHRGREAELVLDVLEN